MKRIQPLLATLASALLISWAGAALAADTPDPSKEVTLKGTLLCAKCELHQSDKCQNVLKVTDGDKSTLYYLVQNDLSKSMHPKVCAAPKDNVTVTGTLETKDGKNLLTPSKIDIPKQNP